MSNDDKAILFFDGVCVLCTGFAKFILRHDTRGVILLATAQSALGQKTYAQHGLDTRVFSTNLLVYRGKTYQKSDAFIQSMWLLGGWKKLAIAIKLCPRIVRDLVYDPIARNRYRWFGERQSCYLPTPDERSRFLG